MTSCLQDPDTSSRVAFVSIDCAMMGQLVKLFALEQLETLYPGLYTEKNLVLSSTHTHSGPAGYMQYVLFNVPNLGFIQGRVTQCRVDWCLGQTRLSYI